MICQAQGSTLDGACATAGLLVSARRRASMQSRDRALTRGDPPWTIAMP